MWIVSHYFDFSNDVKEQTYRPGFLLLFVNADRIGNSRLVIAADDVRQAHLNYHITELRRKK
jgi:hypothetical protein